MQHNIYARSLSIWLLILFAISLPTIFLGMEFVRFFKLYVLANCAGALIFFWHYRYHYEKEYNLNRRHNLLKKDLTLLFLIIFGPFGFLPLIYVLIAINDRSRGRFLEYLKYVEFSDIKDEGYALIDITSEFKKQMFKEPVIDSIKYGSIQKKRSAVEFLYKMKTARAISALLSMARDPEFEIRFLAINKLTALEDEFVGELDWYRTLISVAGGQPDVLFQYAVLQLKFAQSGLLLPEIARLYLERAARIFETLIARGFNLSSSAAGRARALRLSGRLSQACSELWVRIPVLAEEGIDELAVCLFELGGFDELKKLIARVRTGQVKPGRMLSAMMAGKETDDAELGESYTITRLSDCVALFDRGDSLDFDVILGRLKAATSSHMLVSIYELIQPKGMAAKIMYLKLLRGKAEPELVFGVKRFLYEKDKLLNLLAADVLTSTELPLRNEIFLDLLSHDFPEIKLIAIKFLGSQKVENAVPVLSRIVRNRNIDADMRAAAIEALASIGESQTAPGLRPAFLDPDPKVATRAIEAATKYKVSGLERYIGSCLANADARVRGGAARYLAGRGGAWSRKAMSHYAAESDGAIRDMIAAELCSTRDPGAIGLLSSHEFADASLSLALHNYFTYIDRGDLLEYAKDASETIKRHGFDAPECATVRRFFQMFEKHRRDLYREFTGAEAAVHGASGGGRGAKNG